MLTDFQNSFTGIFTSKFAAKLSSLVSQTHLNCVTTLPFKYQCSRLPCSRPDMQNSGT